MIKNKKIRTMIASILGVTTILSTSVIAYAGNNYERSATVVGDTYVITEVGFDGTKGYAFVSAHDDVDASMLGNAFYLSSTGKTMAKVISSNFSEKTYGEVGVTCSNNIQKIFCKFTVSNEYETWEKISEAN